MIFTPIDARTLIMPYNLFISHGSEDTYLVERLLVPALVPTGASIFVDSGAIEIGQDFRTKIFESLRNTNELLVLLTVSALERPWVFAEIGMCAVSEKAIVAIRYGPTEAQLQELGVTSLLGHVKPITLDELDTYAEQLTIRVGSIENG